MRRPPPQSADCGTATVPCARQVRRPSSSQQHATAELEAAHAKALQEEQARRAHAEQRLAEAEERLRAERRRASSAVPAGEQHRHRNQGGAAAEPSKSAGSSD